MDAEYMTERVTLWDMLCESSFTLQLPRFALFLFVSLIILIVLDRKKLSQACSFPTVILQLMTGLLGIYAYYWLYTAAIFSNTRMYIQPWYYPVCLIILCSLTAVFVRGCIDLVTAGRTKNMIVRSVIYCVALYFAFTAAYTPTYVNRSLAEHQWPSDAALPEDVIQIDFRDTLLPFFFHGF